MVTNKNMQSSSMDDLADSLMNKLDRSKVFPPYYNSPEELINPSKVRSVGPPRPPNGFLLCRKNVHRQAKEKGVCNMRVISKVTGILWRGATTDEKEQYENLALQVQNLHSERYPNYKYKPTSRARQTIYQQPYSPYTVPPQQRVVSPLIASEPMVSYSLPASVPYNNNNNNNNNVILMQGDVDLYSLYMSSVSSV